MSKAKQTGLPKSAAAVLVLASQSAGGEPYTTSEIIAGGTGIEHRKLRVTIRKYQTALDAFGKVAPYQETLPGSKTGQAITGYILNEQQATFLLTLLKNTPVVVEFKKELVRQFYAMRDELARRRELRATGKPIRRSLTDALRDSGEVERMHGHAYGTYTDLAYKLATGRTARQLRQERGAAKDANAADLLTASELEAYQRKEAAIAVLLDAGLDYDTIKAVLARGEVQQ